MADFARGESPLPAAGRAFLPQQALGYPAKAFYEKTVRMEKIFWELKVPPLRALGLDPQAKCRFCCSKLSGLADPFRDQFPDRNVPERA